MEIGHPGLRIHHHHVDNQMELGIWFISWFESIVLNPVFICQTYGKLYYYLLIDFICQTWGNIWNRKKHLETGSYETVWFCCASILCKCWTNSQLHLSLSPPPPPPPLPPSTHLPVCYTSVFYGLFCLKYCRYCLSVFYFSHLFTTVVTNIIVCLACRRVILHISFLVIPAS